MGFMAPPGFLFIQAYHKCPLVPGATVLKKNDGMTAIFLLQSGPV
jgi:hypothetical protein